jgi:hypothetical protein
LVRSWNRAIGVRGGVFCFYLSELLLMFTRSILFFRFISGFQGGGKESRPQSDLFPLATERKKGGNWTQKWGQVCWHFYDIPTKREAKLCFFRLNNLYIYISSQQLTGPLNEMAFKNKSTQERVSLATKQFQKFFTLPHSYIPSPSSKASNLFSFFVKQCGKQHNCS